MRWFARFRRDEDGAVALWTGLFAFVLFGVVGAGLDFGRSITTREAMRNYVDGMAIQLATNTTPATFALQNLPGAGVARNNVQDLTFTAQWLSPTDMQVNGSGKVQTSLMAAVPGMSRYINVSVKALARVNVKYVSKTPQMSMLDPEAGDYNQLFLYCFEPAGVDFPDDGSKPGDIASHRTQMTLIADNGGTKYNFAMPACPSGQNLSIRLRNVRNMRGTPSMWNQTTSEQYNWYSDITLDKITYAPIYHFEDNVNILETYVCKDMNECQVKTKNGSGIIDAGKNRTPHQAGAACKKGEFTYYGFEDRPPQKKGVPNKDYNQSATDQDYDDIRLIMECPETTGSRTVFLVQ